MESAVRSSFHYAVERMMDRLTESLHTVVDGLIMKLYDCFTEAERQEINASRTNIQKVEKLFTTLKTKDVSVYERCLRAMQDLQHAEIASALKEEWKKQPSVPSLLSRKLLNVAICLC